MLRSEKKMSVSNVNKIINLFLVPYLFYLLCEKLNVI